MTKTELLEIAKPILFNTEMVQAVLDNRKTATRRAIKPQPKTCCDDGFIYDKIANNLYCKGCGNPFINSKHKECMPKYQIGDYLYVRETFMKCDNDFIFRTSTAYPPAAMDFSISEFGQVWRPSIHMPKEATRIFLRVTDVRVERLQDITFEQIEKEGVAPHSFVSKVNREIAKKQGLRINIMRIWNSTIKKQDLDRYGWSANPWVWVIEFERVETDG